MEMFTHIFLLFLHGDLTLSHDENLHKIVKIDGLCLTLSFRVFENTLPDDDLQIDVP
jgi:hypothetical protein